MPSFGRAPSQCSSRPRAPRLQLGEQPSPRRVDVLPRRRPARDLDRPCPRVTEAQLEMPPVVHQRRARKAPRPAQAVHLGYVSGMSVNAARVTGSVATRSAMIAAESTVSCRTAVRAWIAPDRAPENVGATPSPCIASRALIDIGCRTGAGAS